MIAWIVLFLVFIWFPKVRVHAVKAVVAGNMDENACGTTTFPCQAKAAVAYAPAGRTDPGLQNIHEHTEKDVRNTGHTPRPLYSKYINPASLACMPKRASAIFLIAFQRPIHEVKACIHLQGPEMQG